MSDEAVGRSVSVVIPTKDRRVVLERTLRTVLAQRDVELEVIVVDDGSHDDTTSWLASHADPRVRCVRNEQSLGVAAARNRGVREAGCDWVAFLDDDDWWVPGKLAAQLAALDAQPSARWCTVGAAVVDDALRLLRADTAPDAVDLATTLLYRNAIPGGCSGVLAMRTLVHAVGGFDEHFSMMADWDLWIRLAAAAPAAAVPEPLVCYVQHTANMSHDSAQSDRELAMILSKHDGARRTARVSGVDPGTQRWIARNVGFAGRRTDAARRYLALARRTRAPGMLRLAARAVLGPRWFAASSRRDARRLPRERRDAALRAINEVHCVLTGETVA